MLELRAIANIEELACDTEPRHYSIEKSTRAIKSSKRGRGALMEFIMRADIESEVVEKNNGEHKRLSATDAKLASILHDLENYSNRSCKESYSNPNPKHETPLSEVQYGPALPINNDSSSNEQNSPGAINVLEMREIANIEELACVSVPRNYGIKKSTKATKTSKRGRGAHKKFTMRADIEDEIIEKNRKRRTKRPTDSVAKWTSILCDLDDYASSSCEESYSSPTYKHESLGDVEYGPVPPKKSSENPGEESAAAVTDSSCQVSKKRKKTKAQRCKGKSRSDKRSKKAKITSKKSKTKKSKRGRNVSSSKSDCDNTQISRKRKIRCSETFDDNTDNKRPRNDSGYTSS